MYFQKHLQFLDALLLRNEFSLCIAFILKLYFILIAIDNICCGSHKDINDTYKAKLYRAFSKLLCVIVVMENGVY